MGKKNKRPPSVEEVLARPWCYYCERDFDDLKILLNHQKAKHFKCDKCNRRLNTAGGLSVHMNQVHKEALDAVENALPNRSGLNVEIFGMEGIPEDISQQHNQRVIQEYHQNQADRRAATGNPVPGTGDGHVSKKPKLEAPSDIKARLAAFKAKKAAGELPNQNNGNATPTSAGQGDQSPGAASPSPYQQGQASAYQPPQYAPPPQSQYPQAYGAPGYGITPHPNFAQAPSPFAQGPPGFQQHSSPFGHAGMPPFPAFGQPPFGAGSPPPGSYNGQFSGSPAPGGMFNRPPGLPPAPGLPSRPSFQAPPVNTDQMQQMHAGQFQNQAPPSFDPRQRQQNPQQQRNDKDQPQVTEADVDSMIADAAQESSAKTQAPAATPAQEKKSKKEKDKDRQIELVYNDGEISPEEKLASMSRYAFDRSSQVDDTMQEVATEAVGANVSGVVAGEDDVVDNQGD